jgi:hypothetical protein
MRRIPWLALGIMGTLSALFVGARLLRNCPIPLPECPLKAHLGIPCATCGLTRCVMALSQGRWAEGFHWHPVAVILGLMAPLAILWDLRRAWSGRAYPPLPESLAWRLGVAGFLAGTWLLQVVRGI